MGAQGPTEGRGARPLKEVDSAERAQLIHGFSWLLPALLVLSVCVAYGSRDLLGWGPLPSLLAGLAVLIGGIAFFYLVMFKGVIGGTASFLGKVYDGGSGPARRQPAYSRVRARVSRGDHGGALSLLEDEVTQDPGDPGPYLAAARICMEDAGDLGQAAAWYYRALAAERIGVEASAYVCMRLADIHEAEGDTGRACVALRRLLDLHPGSHYCESARLRLRELKSGEPGRSGL